MNRLEQDVAHILRKYLSEILAQSLRRRAQTAIGVLEGRLTADDIPRLRRHLGPAIRLFVDPTRQEPLIKELDQLCGPSKVLTAERHEVRDEHDVSVVRVRARELALALGGGTVGAQRAATAASELTRNIVAYAGEGWVELEPAPESLALTIRAVDSGPGIADVDLVLSGRYRSRTGLGKGLLGVRQMATRFEIDTGSQGTRIEAEIGL